MSRIDRLLRNWRSSSTMKNIPSDKKPKKEKKLKAIDHSIKIDSESIALVIDKIDNQDDRS